MISVINPACPASFRSCVTKTFMLDIMHKLFNLILQTHVFLIYYDNRDHYTVTFGTSLGDLDLHSRSHLYEK